MLPPETTALTVGHSFPGQQLCMTAGSESQGAARESFLMDLPQVFGAMPLCGSDGPKHPNTSNATHRTGRISPDLSTGNHCPTQAESSRNEAASPGSTGRRQDALAVFDLYGVSRPEGWLSKGGFRPGSCTKKLQICHSCGESLQPGAQCSRCGHDFCSKCAAEVPETGTSLMRPALNEVNRHTAATTPVVFLWTVLNGQQTAIPLTGTRTARDVLQILLAQT